MIILEFQKKEKINNLALKQAILKILQAQTYEMAMQNYLELYLTVPNHMLKQYLKTPIVKGNKALKDLPIIKRILTDFRKQDIFY